MAKNTTFCRKTKSSRMQRDQTFTIIAHRVTETEKKLKTEKTTKPQEYMKEALP
jgi:hypothetical protein